MFKDVCIFLCAAAYVVSPASFGFVYRCQVFVRLGKRLF